MAGFPGQFRRASPALIGNRLRTGAACRIWFAKSWLIGGLPGGPECGRQARIGRADCDQPLTPTADRSPSQAWPPAAGKPNCLLWAPAQNMHQFDSIGILAQKIESGPNGTFPTRMSRLSDGR
jgi:hypothetical protein